MTFPYSGAWARLVNASDSDEHLALCYDALREIQQEQRRRTLHEAADLGRKLSRDGYSAQEIAKKLDKIAQEDQ